MENTNTIELVGQVTTNPKISHRISMENFYTCVIDVYRLSQEVDSLEIIIPEKLMIHDKLKIGQYVKVEGQIRTYNHHDSEVNKRKLVITVFAKEIQLLDNVSKLERTINNLVLQGYICKEIVYRKTPFGREIADVLLAVNRNYSRSDYIPCILWGRNARFVSKLKIGTKIQITGRMQSRQYEKEIDGKRVSKTAYEISCSNVSIVDEQEKVKENI